MRLFIPATLLLILSIPTRALAQPLSPAELQKKYGNNVQVQIIDDGAEATGPGARATGPDSAKLTQAGGVAPSIATPWGQDNAGNANTTASAESVTGSLWFRWVVGIAAGLVLALGVLLGYQNNVSGAMIVGGTGLAILILDIFFFPWLVVLAVGAILFIALKYAWDHGLITGQVATLVTAIHNTLEAGGKAVEDAFNKSASGIASNSREVNGINKAAAANGATTVRLAA